ncbi:helix-turn-helix domain-containing protein, partial [Telmatospirillum sp.]|uniref:helix-turn-helix domain-containing protein n=1 Tax=Telmatospirillum sp. TaxID=2079197 RepID=UPI00283BE0DD
MNVHKNAKLTPHGRALIAARHEAGETPNAIAMAFGVSPATVYKWLRRFRDEGLS